MRLLRLLSLILLCALALPAQEPTPGELPSRPAHLVFLNAKVWTAEDDLPQATAVAIRGNRIIKVGSNDDVRPFIREGVTRIINLHGKLVLPGFIDADTRIILDRLRGTTAMPSEADLLADLRKALDQARRAGITSIQETADDFDAIDLFRQLQKSDELTVRVWARFPLVAWTDVREYLRLYRIPPASNGWGDQYIRLGGLEARLDGHLDDSTALLDEPYQDQPENRGAVSDIMQPAGKLDGLLREADLAGFNVTLGASGDHANHLLLDAYQTVFAMNPPRDRRFRIADAQLLDPADAARAGKLGLIAEVHPYACLNQMPLVEERLGPIRLLRACRFHDLAAAGARLVFGSQWSGAPGSLLLSPLLNIYAAVTRQTPDAPHPGGWLPDQQLSVEEALRAYTINGAYATFEEGIKGSIKEGKLADLVVLDRDILTLPPEQLLKAQVVYTLFDGRIVYDQHGEPEKPRTEPED